MSIFSVQLIRERFRIFLIGIQLFIIFGLSVIWLPKLLPESLKFISSIVAFLSWVAMIFVILALCGFGPLAKDLNKIAIEEDEEERKKYARSKQPWER